NSWAIPPTSSARPSSNRQRILPPSTSRIPPLSLIPANLQSAFCNLHSAFADLRPLSDFRLGSAFIAVSAFPLPTPHSPAARCLTPATAFRLPSTVYRLLLTAYCLPPAAYLFA